MRDENSSDGVSVINLACASDPVLLTGTLTLTELASITIPGGLLGPTGAIDLGFLFTLTGASAKTLRVTWGGTLVWTTAPAASLGFVMPSFVIANRGIASQITQPSGSTVAGAVGVPCGVAAIDTSVDQALSITGQLANVGDSIMLEHFRVTLRGITPR